MSKTLRPHSLALAFVLAFSALLEGLRLERNGWANEYYSAAVRSMLSSLHDFFFVSSDPGGLVTVDKPPLGLWLQVASARVFGLHPLSLLIPEALCAVATVAVVYRIVAPRFGVWAGVAAAATLAVFPSFVASGRDNNLDALLLLLMTLGCLAGLRAVESGSWRWLLAAALLVGLAFDTKTLAAYLVLPGLMAAWLVCAPVTLRRRLALLAAATAVLAATSLVWLVAVEAVPKDQRPYVGGTTNDSELSLAFGHNGLGRVLGERGAPGQIVHGRAPAPTSAPTRGLLMRTARERTAHRAPGITSTAGPPGVLRLLDPALGDQCAWLLPLALGGLLAAALTLRGAPRSDRRLAVLLVMGGWFAVEAVVLSVSRGIVAPYYVSALGPGVAGLIGAASWAVGELRRRDPLGLIVPAAGLLAALSLELLLAHREYAYLRWLWPLLVVAVAGSAALMLWSARRALLAWAIAVPALLVLPAAYSTSVWAVPVDGTFPAAGPYIPDNLDARSYGIPPDDVQSYRTLLRYVRSHHRGSRWDVLVQGSNTAAALILLGGRAAALGGYGTTDPVLAPAQLAHVVTSGETRYVALGGGYASRGGNAASAAVAVACREVPPQRWRAPHNFGTAAHPRYAFPEEGWNLVLYDCAGRAARLASA